jgi:D-tyrosyl-tRNA(Tyr) deacylase
VRAVIQRVRSARVSVGERTVGSIGIGLLVLLGIGRDDTTAEVDWVLDKLLGMRLFENELGKLDYSVRDVGGELLVVSQFTLFADTRKGRRPSFSNAAPPEHAVPLYEYFIERARSSAVPLASGEFGAHMAVELINDGPVTILLDTAEARGQT